MATFIELIWLPFSSVIKLLPAQAQGGLIVICGSAGMAIFRDLVTGEKECKPQLGMMLGCLFVLLFALLLILLPP